MSMRDVMDKALRLFHIAKGAESRFIEIEDATLHYYRFGERTDLEPVLLLHGLGDSANTWTRILYELGKEREVVALDLAGHGFSTLAKHRGFLTLREQVGLVETFAQVVMDGPFQLVGQSLGGWIALHYALFHPTRVARLVLINNAGIRTQFLEERQEDLRKVWRPQTKEELQELWKLMWAKPPWISRVFAGEGLERVRRERVQGFLDSVTATDFLDDELRFLEPYTVVIWGREDRLVPIESVSVMQRRIQRMRVIWLDGCGHIPQAECPAALKQALLDAVSGPAPRPPG